MIKQEIQCLPPQHSPDYAGLNRILPHFESILPEISSGDVLDRHKTYIAATFLLARPDLVSYFLKAMHFEFPPYTYAATRFMQPESMLSLLSRGIDHARSQPATGTLELDLFTTQFEDNAFRFLNFLPEQSLQSATNITSRGRFHHRTVEEKFNFYIRHHRNSKIRWRTIARGIFTANPHTFSDGLPASPLNILRYHDHRKIMIFEFGENKEVMLLPTCNFDRPLDLDYSLVITDKNIIATTKNLLAQHSPRNARIESENWSVYQDGTEDLDPTQPVTSSPILSRVHELIQAESTHTIEWCSQFLPDLDDLKLFEKRLQSGSLELLTLYAPNASHWSSLYKLSGGIMSKYAVERLAKKYPAQVRLFYTDRYLHAKALIINKQRLLVTSHNFNRTLVQSRTSELGLELHSMPEHTRIGIEAFLSGVTS